MKKILEKIVKSKVCQSLLVYILHIYLKFAYSTSKWQVVFLDQSINKDINKYDKAIFAHWHGSIAFALQALDNCKNISALASPHRDGKLMTDLIKLRGHKVVEGSTNRNPMGAVKLIINELKLNNKIVITPDGPRGPAKEINSNIVKIADKYADFLIPLACASNKYFALNSWDKMMIPKPFSKIAVVIGTNFVASGDEEMDNKNLKDILNKLAIDAKNLLDKTARKIDE